MVFTRHAGNGILHIKKHLQLRNKELLVRMKEVEDLEKELESVKEALKVALKGTWHWKDEYDDYFASFIAGGSHNEEVENTADRQIKPQAPIVLGVLVGLETFPEFLDDVEKYVRVVGVVCPGASIDNQHIDTMRRFLDPKISGWLETHLQQQGINTIPPPDYDYGITWASFNPRALEFVEVLGGSPTITSENPLWHEYLLKLPLAPETTSQMTLNMPKLCADQGIVTQHLQT
ncbi:hypothetical protein BZA05DRAFT_422610 [Tricharina praecox]|uniref:uncharacterized protein n=1 Tax=Tricharina praecox TaxID=43433 RepID=UPI00221FDA77|nr:uncharacterized protein BZA05DRAFT_422610 [Tricharina praecox]KAI5842266.1 hypothetical protein BZA05DRAFT_422610 [Tricharina praecox]